MHRILKMSKLIVGGWSYSVVLMQGDTKIYYSENGSKSIVTINVAYAPRHYIDIVFITNWP
jgi:hypothetical protein